MKAEGGAMPLIPVISCVATLLYIAVLVFLYKQNLPLNGFSLMEMYQDFEFRQEFCMCLFLPFGSENTGGSQIGSLGHRGKKR